MNISGMAVMQMLSGLRSPVSGFLRLASVLCSLTSVLPPSPKRYGAAGWLPAFAQALRRGRLASALWLLSSGFWLLTSCSLPIPPAQPDLTRYFILQPQGQTGGPAERTGGPLVRLRSVDVPAYLVDRPLAVRRGASEIHYLASARWAEPLDQGLTRNIRLGLGSYSGFVVLARYDSAEKWDYDLKIRLSACEGAEDRSVLFKADWVLEPAMNSSLPRKAGTFSGKDLKWDGTTPESLVAALSEGVTQLCGTLADALKPAG